MDDLLALPDAARFAWWATAWLRDLEGTDRVLDAIRGDDAVHVVAAADEPRVPASRLLDGLLDVRGTGADAAGLALPVEADLLGLGGPAALNVAALEAGEAVYAGGLALVPVRTGASVTWLVRPAAPRQLPDVGEADRALRAALVDAAGRLADLDVARWDPEVADLLMNLRHLPAVVAPAGTPGRCVELAARGLQARAIVEVALRTDGAAVTGHEASARRAALEPLGRAGRRALVAACSPEVWPPAR